MGSLNAQILMKFKKDDFTSATILFLYTYYKYYNIYYYIYVIYKAQVQSDINRIEKIFAYLKVIHII